jgi:hypothetical protein
MLQNGELTSADEIVYLECDFRKCERRDRIASMQRRFPFFSFADIINHIASVQSRDPFMMLGRRELRDEISNERDKKSANAATAREIDRYLNSGAYRQTLAIVRRLGRTYVGVNQTFLQNHAGVL